MHCSLVWVCLAGFQNTFGTFVGLQPGLQQCMNSFLCCEGLSQAVVVAFGESQSGFSHGSQLALPGQVVLMTLAVVPLCVTCHMLKCNLLFQKLLQGLRGKSVATCSGCTSQWVCLGSCWSLVGSSCRSAALLQIQRRLNNSKELATSSDVGQAIGCSVRAALVCSTRHSPAGPSSAVPQPVLHTPCCKCAEPVTVLAVT